MSEAALRNVKVLSVRPLPEERLGSVREELGEWEQLFDLGKVTLHTGLHLDLAEILLPPGQHLLAKTQSIVVKFNRTRRWHASYK